MVNILVSEEEYDKVFNHLDTLHAPLEGKLEAYDGEINFRVEENMISNEYAVKLCLEHEVKRGNKIFKKKLIVALRGEIYFVKFIINPEEYDVEPRVIFGRSFLRMTKEITGFRAGTITIYPDVGNKSSSRVNTAKIHGYALWEVIENGNSWVPIPVTTPPETGTSTTTKMTVPATIEEKTCKKNDVKARSLLLMALPNEHQLTFDQLQKLVSRLAILGVKVKKSAGASNDDKNLAFVTTSGASSTNNINTVNPEVSTAQPQGNAEHIGVKTTEIANSRQTWLSWHSHILSDTDFKAATYKRGLATLEGQIVKYKEHEVFLSEEIALLKRSVGSKEYELGLLRTEFEKVKQEKEGVDFKIAKFDKSAKDLNEMLDL
ncbi:hypothetical protein Tco_1255034 [Tanacetum coccineum]